MSKNDFKRFYFFRCKICNFPNYIEDKLFIAYSKIKCMFCDYFIKETDTHTIEETTQKEIEGKCNTKSGYQIANYPGAKESYERNKM